MSNYIDTQPNPKDIVDFYIDSLNGYYRKYCCDEMLKAVLLWHYTLRYLKHQSEISNVSKQQLMQMAAYEAAYIVFKNFIEIGCNLENARHMVSEGTIKAKEFSKLF